MSIRSIRYLPETDALALAPDGSAIFSITEPGRLAALRPGWGRVFRHQFIDTEYNAQSLRLAGIDWWLASGAIGPLQALEIQKQIAALAESPTPWEVICHCHAGRSRSAALAHYMADVHGAQLLQARSPKANRTVLALLHDPWCLIQRQTYEQTMYPRWKRMALAIRRWLAPVHPSPISEKENDQ